MAPSSRNHATALLARPDLAWPTPIVALAAIGSFVGFGLAAAGGAVAWPIAVPVQAVAAFACFTPMHDASHGAIARARWLNALVGWVCGVPLLAPFAAFRALHLQHHAHTNDPAADPDMWSGRAASRPTMALRWAVKDLHYLARYVAQLRARAPDRRPPRGEALQSAAGFVAIWGGGVALAATGHGLELVVLWLVPSRIAILALSIVFDWLPHQPRVVLAADDPYRATNVVEHRWLSPLVLCQNYHLVHHLFPGVPFYRYGHVYWTLRDDLVARGADIRRIGGRRPARPPARVAELPPLRVANVVPETPDTRTFVLEVPEASRTDYAYRAGQFVVVEIPVSETRRVRRCYSLSRAPGRADRSLAITVKRRADGAGSAWLHDHVRVGTTLRVGRPEGRFVLAPGPTRPLLLFAAGSGITPIIAILEDALAATSRRATLVYANRDARHVIFAARLAALERAHGARLAIVHHLDSERGVLDAAAVAPRLDRHADVYVCGPEPFMEVVERAAAAAGIPADHRFAERFTPRPVGGPARPDRAPIAAGFTAIRHGARHHVAVAPTETLLAAARRAGLAPRSSCEDGYCGTCAARLACGRIDARAVGPLSDAELATGFILPCSARPLAGDPVVVDFDVAPELAGAAARADQPAATEDPA